jgi:hypothetical protein
MKIRVGFFGGPFTRSPDWELAFDNRAVTLIAADRAPISIPLHTLTQVTAKPGLFWAKIEAISGRSSIRTSGICNRAGQRFTDALTKAAMDSTSSTLRTTESRLRPLIEETDRELQAPRYFAQRDLEKWRANVTMDQHALLARHQALSKAALIGQRRILMIQCLDVIRRSCHVRQISIGGQRRAA